MKKASQILIIIFLLLIVAGSTGSESVHAFLTLDTAQEVINVINQYRVENGLPALIVNSDLMAAAQRHSNYMAASGLITHSEPDGSTPKMRAQAEGYGEGYIIYISEIIYGGWNQTAQDAIDWWKASPNHNPWILHAQYIDIGAGAASNGPNNYYTALLAAVTVWEDPNYPPQSTEETPGATEETPTSPTSTPTPYPTPVPVVTATPGPDGSVIHIVQPGQYLSMIAAAYGVSIDTLYELNGLNQHSILYVGDEIIVVPPQITQPTSTPTNTSIPENTATATIIPTNTEPPVSGFTTPTPLPDGSIVHILEPGQVLWDLSVLYDIPLATLLQLNGLYEWSIVHPGDEIIISPPYTPTATATQVPPTATPTLLPTFTPTTVTPTETEIVEEVEETEEVIEPTAEVTEDVEKVVPTETQIPIATENESSTSSQNTDRETMLIVLIILVGLLFMLISFVLIFRNK